jgi:hypothetical protein
VTCRMPRDGRPLGRPVAPLHPPRRPCDTPHRHTQRLAGLARQRAPVPAGATVRAGRAAEGPKGHRPCTGQRALTARTPPPTRRLPPPAPQPRGRKRRPPPRCLLIRGRERAPSQLGHHLAQEQHQVAFGQLGPRAMGLLPSILRCPETRGATTTRAHHDAPGAGGIERDIQGSY